MHGSSSGLLPHTSRHTRQRSVQFSLNFCKVRSGSSKSETPLCLLYMNNLKPGWAYRKKAYPSTRRNWSSRSQKNSCRNWRRMPSRQWRPSSRGDLLHSHHLYSIYRVIDWLIDWLNIVRHPYSPWIPCLSMLLSDLWSFPPPALREEFKDEQMVDAKSLDIRNFIWTPSPIPTPTRLQTLFGWSSSSFPSPSPLPLSFWAQLPWAHEPPSKKKKTRRVPFKTLLCNKTADSIIWAA